MEPMLRKHSWENWPGFWLIGILELEVNKKDHLLIGPGIFWGYQEERN